MNFFIKIFRSYSVIIILTLIILLNLLTPGFTGKRDEWQQPEKVMKEMNFKPGSHVADIGCGKGYFTFRITEAVGKDGKVFAADINKKALAKLQERAKGKKYNNIEFILSEPTNTKVPNASADAALICLVLHHVPENQRQALIRSIYKALKPGGFLFVMDFRKVHNPPHHTYEELVSREEVIKLAETAGMKLDKEWDYLEHQYFLRLKK